TGTSWIKLLQLLLYLDAGSCSVLTGADIQVYCGNDRVAGQTRPKLMQRNWPQCDRLLSKPVAALQRDLSGSGR
ncbi:hypothetical protein, partial [Ruegeria sp. HKCCD5851]|uniref:hypothetical protein n=1 Tax=Ruegeria sp. HKCCD5851 TaxID=2683008 RepID=UPI001C11B4DE